MERIFQGRSKYFTVVLKTQLIVLCRKGKQKDVKSVKVHVDGKEVSKLEAVKYLGVVIDKVLSWKQHIDGVRRKCYAKLIFFFFF